MKCTRRLTRSLITMWACREDSGCLRLISGGACSRKLAESVRCKFLCVSLSLALCGDGHFGRVESRVEEAARKEREKGIYTNMYLSAKVCVFNCLMVQWLTPPLSLLLAVSIDSNHIRQRSLGFLMTLCEPICGTRVHKSIG